VSTHDVSTCVPGAARRRSEVLALVAGGEAPTAHRPGQERAGLVGLPLLLSANPNRDEPIEDSSDGMLQNLACAATF
jgi:hypothetical protein